MRNCDLFSMLEKVKWQSQTKYFDKQNQKSTRGLLTGKVPGSRCGCQCLFFVMQNVWVNGRELVMEHIGWYLTDCEDVYMQVTERFCCLLHCGRHCGRQKPDKALLSGFIRRFPVWCTFLHLMYQLTVCCTAWHLMYILIV